MNHWIDLGALGKIVLAALVFGAGLPGLFGVGLRAVGRERPGSGGTASSAVAVGVLCFAVVAAAVGYGIYLIVAGT